MRLFSPDYRRKNADLTLNWSIFLDSRSSKTTDLWQEIEDQSNLLQSSNLKTIFKPNKPSVCTCMRVIAAAGSPSRRLIASAAENTRPL